MQTVTLFMPPLSNAIIPPIEESPSLWGVILTSAGWSPPLPMKPEPMESIALNPQKRHDASVPTPFSFVHASRCIKPFLKKSSLSIVTTPPVSNR